MSAERAKRGGPSLHSFIMREAASTGRRKDRPIKLSKAQRRVLELLKSGVILKGYLPPGSFDILVTWYFLKPYSDEDGRTCGSLYTRGLIFYAGDDDYELTPAGRAALERAGDRS